MQFPVSGVEVSPLVPFSVAFVVSFFTSMGGVSGAFLLLPFQVSVLGFTSPAVSATNLVYNIVAIPSGVYRYIKEGRMAWPLAWIIIAGTLPGVFIGALVRIKCLPDPRHFKMFVGCVLLYVSLRLFYGLMPWCRQYRKEAREMEDIFNRRHDGQFQAREPGSRVIVTKSFSLREYSYTFYGETFSFYTLALFGLTFAVGIVGGAYGIGGSAIIAPFLVAVFGLPVHSIAGATLLGTYITSIAGVIFYCLMAPLFAKTGMAVAPDWALGALFGAGGFLGMYCGARAQKFFPSVWIELILAVAIFLLSVDYILVA